jgi:hypothetical protein
MTHIPNIPMLPGLLPQQRVNLVVDLPPRPEGVAFMVGYRIFPEPQMERRPWPRLAEYLVQVEFAETPMHCGLSAFYIEARRGYWMLWERYHDDNTWPHRWRWQASGYCLRDGVDMHTAAVHLLLDFWKMADETPEDDDHWINETGLLSIEDIRAISREIQAGRAAAAAARAAARGAAPCR